MVQYIILSIDKCVLSAVFLENKLEKHNFRSKERPGKEAISLVERSEDSGLHISVVKK